MALIIRYILLVLQIFIHLVTGSSLSKLSPRDFLCRCDISTLRPICGLWGPRTVNRKHPRSWVTGTRHKGLYYFKSMTISGNAVKALGSWRQNELSLSSLGSERKHVAACPHPHSPQHPGPSGSPSLRRQGSL